MKTQVCFISVWGTLREEGGRKWGAKSKEEEKLGANFIAEGQNNLAVLCGGYLTVTTKIHVKPHPDAFRALGFLVLNYWMQRDRYLALLSPTKDHHKQIQEK